MRHLLELLDGDVEKIYRAATLDYRPRFTPVMRALRDHGALSIKEIAAYARVTHSAASQTVTAMKRKRLLSIAVGMTKSPITHTNYQTHRLRDTRVGIDLGSSELTPAVAYRQAEAKLAAFCLRVSRRISTLAK